MFITTEADGTVRVYGNTPLTPPDGGTLYELTESQNKELRDIIETRPQTVKFNGETFTTVSAKKTPVCCSAWQFRKEVRVIGIKADVDSLIANQDEETKEAFEYATEYWSDNPLLLSLAAQLPNPLTEEQIYEMILSASKRVIGG